MNIDEDLLQTAKELAALRKPSAGKILSELARKALKAEGWAGLRNGVPVLPKRSGAKPVTSEIVNRLLDAKS